MWINHNDCERKLLLAVHPPDEPLSQPFNSPEGPSTMAQLFIPLYRQSCLCSVSGQEKSVTSMLFSHHTESMQQAKKEF